MVGVYEVEQPTEVSEGVEAGKGTEKEDVKNTVWKQVYGLKAFSPIAKGFPYSEYDDFGASRSYGYQRTHLGHDILGQVGTPIIAIEGGTVRALGWNQFGGWRIGIDSFDGKRYYYYAHLRQDRPCLLYTSKDGRDIMLCMAWVSLAIRVVAGTLYSFGVPIPILLPFTGKVGIIADTMSTVSYTHLDVYKRQMLDEENESLLEEPVMLTEEQVCFVPDKSEYLDEDAALETIKPIADYLAQNNQITILLAGTTAGDEDSAYTMALSHERADAVKASLVALGVDESRIIAVGLGSSDPWHVSGAGYEGSIASLSLIHI